MTANRTWSASAYESGICHYCGGKAGTVDHIVPRCALPKPMSRLPYWFRSHNEVPSCQDCNGKKANFRSDCTCPTCEWAWRVAIKEFLIPNVIPDGIVKLVRSPA